MVVAVLVGVLDGTVVAVFVGVLDGTVVAVLVAVFVAVFVNVGSGVDVSVGVLDGTVEIAVSGKPATVKQGEMLIMPANEPHALKAVDRFKMMLIMIKS